MKRIIIILVAEILAVSQINTVIAAKKDAINANEIKYMQQDKKATTSFEEALELFKAKMYGMALTEFEKIKKNGNSSLSLMQIDSYIVLCKIQTTKTGLQNIIDAYIEKYPASSYLNNIYFKYGCQLFDNNSYTEALEYFNKVKHITKDDLAEYQFRHAYCLLRVGEQQAAKKEFESLIDSIKRKKIKGSSFITAAEYYLGYILYSEQNFNEAIPHFFASSHDQRFSELADYHIFECKFMTDDYKYVTKNGEKLYSSIAQEYKPRIARMLSEAYYKENNTAKAQKFFKLYSDSGINLTPSDNFYSGIMSYSLKMYKQAIESFAKVISSPENSSLRDRTHIDSLIQSAFYFSGNSYIQLNDKYSAKDAFLNASKMSNDLNIKEDAYFNYAKLSFDLNKLTEPFNTYLSNFNYSQKKADEIYNYIATAFLLEHNYTDALDALNKISKKTQYTENNIQKASFLQGIQLIDNGGYSAAIPYFESASEQGNNQDLSNLADFWLAECLYRTDKFADASAQINMLRTNQRFKRSSEYTLSFFNLGYIDFKLEKYDDAIKDFNQFLYVISDDDPFRIEAMSRIADSYYMKRDYNKAAEIYEKAGVQNNYKDLYAPYQAAICYGLVSKSDKKIALLKDITDVKYSESPYYYQSLYELGRTYVQSSKEDEAISVFNTLIDSSNNNSYYYKSLLELGMIYSNLQYPDKALSHYRQIVENNPSSEEAASALAGMETIYQSQNNTQEFIDYIDKIGLSGHKTTTERETLYYDAAEQDYINGNYPRAINSLKTFISSYPNSEYLANTYFYLAECYNKTDKPEDAIAAYLKVMEQGEGDFSEHATLNYAKLSYAVQDYEHALQGYQTLSHIAKLDNNKLTATQGIMNSAFMTKQYEVAIKNAKILLEKYPKLNEDIKDRAMYIQAKSYLVLDDKTNGEKLLKILAKKPITENGAEANYLLIKMAFDSGKLDKVEDMTFSFSDSDTPQTYWLAKSFIVLGDSYLAQDNIDQAIATYDSIKENYSSENKNDDIIQQLNMRYEELKAIKSKNNN